MGTILDYQLGAVAEVTYGTPLTVTRFYEPTDEDLDYEKIPVQGQGLRAGSYLARGARRVVVAKQVKGGLTVELLSKSMGLLLQAAFGTGVSTLVSGTMYQQLFTTLQAGTVPPSLTIQKGVPDFGGTVNPYTFTGMVVDSWELTCPMNGIASLKLNFDGRDMATATALATKSYVTTPTLFHSAQMLASSIKIGTNANLTAPAATVLGTHAGTSYTNVRELSLKCNNNLTRDRFNQGQAGLKSQPVYGIREITGKLTFEYTQNTERDIFIADTQQSLLWTYDTGVTLGASNEQMQIAIPALYYDDVTPNPDGTDGVMLEVPFTVLESASGQAGVYLALRTADAAL